MFEEYAVLKKIRRFSTDITVLKKGETEVQFVNDERYLDAYKKLMEKVGSKGIKIVLTFISDEYISFMCRTESKCIALNFSVSSGYFERDKNVIKYAGIDRKKVKCIMKKSLRSFGSVYLIPRGVGVLCDERGEHAVKIRL